MGFEGIRKGKKPRTGPRDTIEAEVSDPVATVRRRIKQVMINLGLQFGRQTLLGRGTGTAINTCVWKKRSPMRGLDIRTHEAAVEVVFIKTWPDTSAKLLSVSQAGDICSRSVLKCTAGPEAAIGHADAGNTPIVIRKWAADKPPKRVANLLISLTRAVCLEGRGYRSARLEHLGPAGEGALRVGVANDGVQKIASLDNTTLKKGLTPRLGADSSSEQLDVAVEHSSATLKVMRREILNRCAGRDHLSLVAGNVQTNLEETLFEGDDLLDRRRPTCNDPIVEKGVVVEITWEA